MLLLPVHSTAGNRRLAVAVSGARHAESAPARCQRQLPRQRPRPRKQAEHLRDNAKAPYLTASQRATLLREAEAAERQADWWLDAIEAD